MRSVVDFTTRTTWNEEANGTKSVRISSQDFTRGSNPSQHWTGWTQRAFDHLFVHRELTLHRFKPEMWSKVAEEMAVPWRAAEAMHWQLGEADMARRAGVVPFSLSSASTDAPPQGHRSSPSRGHSHSQSQSSVMSGPPGPGQGPGRYSRPPTAQGSSSSKAPGGGSARTIAARRESTPRSVPPASPSDGLALAAIGGGGMAMGMGRGGQMLPSVAEMTTGVSPYSTPAYAMSMPMSGGYPSPGPMLPSIGMMGGNRPEGKRRGSPDMGPRETSRRRQ